MCLQDGLKVERKAIPKGKFTRGRTGKDATGFGGPLCEGRNVDELRASVRENGQAKGEARHSDNGDVPRKTNEHKNETHHYDVDRTPDLVR